MSDRSNFLGGFILGTIVGGVVGGIAGSLAASRLGADEDEGFKLDSAKKPRQRKPLSLSTEENMEIARQGLEDKIAQLNDAIDDVRQQLNTVNGRPEEANEPSMSRDL
jgi:gas vesicle protein